LFHHRFNDVEAAEIRSFSTGRDNEESSKHLIEIFIHTSEENKKDVK